MTLIDHLMETGRVPDTAGHLLTAVAGSAASVAQDPQTAQRSQQRMDHNKASPQGIKALAAVYAHIRQSALPHRLVELVYLRVSQLNGCAFCIDMHSRELVTAGGSAEHLLLLPVWREARSLFDQQEQAALAWAEAVTNLGDHGVSDAEFEAAGAVFDEKQLTDLTIAIGLMSAYNRLAISFRSTPSAVAGN